MIYLVVICVLIQIVVIFLAVKNFYHIHGLEVAIFILGVSSLAVLSVYAMEFVRLKF
jgi:hypothetical protein